jgi:hypothetical protein
MKRKGHTAIKGWLPILAPGLLFSGMSINYIKTIEFFGK